MNGSKANDHNDFTMSRHMIDVSVHEGPRHRPLTPFRFLRGILCLIVLLSTALMMMIYFGPFTAVVLRLFSIHYSRKVMSSLFGCWLALWPFLFEKINETKVVFAGDKVPPGERVLIIANHRTEVDWMYLWDLALRKGRLGYIKYVLKNSLMKLPIFGWGFHILEFISVARRWDVDQSGMRQILSTFSNPHDPLWLAVFPEGTDFSDQKCLESQKFASENGLPVLKYVLLPKTKGFNVCMEYLRNSINAVYDVTIGYKHRCPSLKDNVFGVDPSEVHIHITRIPLSSIPVSEDKIPAWLIERFKIKDQLLSNFTTRGCFPQNDVEDDLSTTKCLVYTTGILSFTVISMYLTFFSSVWFKVYVVLSATYLASATYFNIRPSPLLGRIFTRIKNE